MSVGARAAGGLAAAALSLAALCAAGASGSPGQRPSAQARAVLVGGSSGPLLGVTASGGGAGKRSGNLDRGRLFRVNGGHVAAGTALAGFHAGASASVGTASVRVFDELVKAAAVSVRLDDRGNLTGRIADLAIGGGLPIGDVRGPRSFDLDGHGSLDTFVLTADGGIAALRARLDRDYEGIPAGTEVQVGRVSAVARSVSPPRPAVRLPRPDRLRGRRAARSRHGRREGHRRRRPTAGQRRARLRSLLRRRAIERVRSGSYLFPVSGGASFSDDYGAYRASTRRSHEGNDVFAPFGAPVLAVADGTLFNVGTLPISGNRVWLRDRQGNTFFYAHLAAFSHRAVDGASVRAGETLGFAGSTGDAKPTPPHLHFEIHPADGDPVDPYPFLRRWPHGPGLDPALRRRRNPPPGVLVELRDLIAEN